MPTADPDPQALDRLIERFPQVEAARVDELPVMWAAVVARMRREGLIRSHTSVPAELAERLVARWLGGELQPQATKGVDVVTPEGRAVQVKALRYSNPGRSSVASFSADLVFTDLVVVCFEYDMTVREALVFDAEQVVVRSDDRPDGLLTPAGRRLSLGPRVRAAARVVSGPDLMVAGGGRGSLGR